MPDTRRLTKRLVDALKPGETLWDSDVSGFGVRCQRRSKVFVLKVRVRRRQRWFSIGAYGSPWTVEKARDRARAIRGSVADGEDPARNRDGQRGMPTVSKLAEAFLAEHVAAKRKPRTLTSYRDLLERLARPELGHHPVDTVEHADIARLHHKLQATPYQANRLVAVLSKMFEWAEHRGYRAAGSNPCRFIEKYPERGRERFLSEAELARLADALQATEQVGTTNPFAIAALRLLVFTGARCSEILGLRWEHVDINAAMISLPDSKTGKRTIYLSPPALQVLAALPRLKGNPHVICGEKAGAALVNLQKPWRRIRSAAGLDDVRLHDLRHSFASMAAGGGLSLPMIGKLLGHSQAATTQRYAHLAADPVRAANEVIGLRIAAVMTPGNAKLRVG